MVEILLMIWVLLAAFGFGALLLRLFPNKYSQLEHFVFSTGLGFGAIAYLMMGLGFLCLWYTLVAYGLLIILSVVGFINIKSHIGEIEHWGKNRTGDRLSKFSVLVGLIILGHMLVNLIGDLAPPLNGDTLGSYLVWPKMWVQNNSIFQIHDHPWSFMPVNAWVLSGLGLLLRSDVLSQLLVGYLMSVLGAAVVYSIARKNFPNELSLLAATIFYCTPVMIWLVYSAKVDLLMAFFELLAFYAFFNFFFEENEQKALKWFLLSAVFCGLSVGTKYLAFSAVIIGCGLMIHYFTASDTKKNVWRYVKYVALFVSIVAVIGCPIYVRNMIRLGNPFYPLLSEVYDTGKLFWQFRESEGILGYFDTFWLWSTQQTGVRMTIGPIFIFSIPCLLFMRKIDRHIKLLFAMVFAGSLLCYMISPRPRHMLSEIGLLSIVAGYAVVKMRGMQKTVKYGATAVVIGMLLFNLSLDIWRNLLTTHKIPYIFGSINREEFLRRAFTKSSALPYALIQHINNQLPLNAKILIIGPFMSYYIDRTTVYGWDSAMLKDEIEIEPYLLQKKATHIFVNPDFKIRGANFYTEYTSSQLPGGDYLSVFRKVFNNSPLFSENFAQRHLKLLFSHDGKYLFEWIPKS